MNTFEKYWWIMEHPSLRPADCYEEPEIDITVHMVNPVTRSVEDLAFLNTHQEFWVELIYPAVNENINNFHPEKWVMTHDIDADCGGDTYDEAVDNLYNRVLEIYGPYDLDDPETVVENFFVSLGLTNDTGDYPQAFSINEMSDGEQNLIRAHTKPKTEKSLAFYQGLDSSKFTDEENEQIRYQIIQLQEELDISDIELFSKRYFSL